MKTFDYMVAEKIEPALAELNENSPTLKAGGIDLLDLMKERIVMPAKVLSIGGISELSYVKEEQGLVYDGIHIGCNTTLADIGRNELLAKKCVALHHAAAHAATPQIRERATLGGNICQRPRCWYFRSDDFNCLKKGGATCFAVEGENRYHAIFGDGPCHIVHPSNVAPALIAMNADFMVLDAKGARRIKAGEFFVMPDKSLPSENVLKSGEILSEVIIPKPPEQSATIELREKQSFDWPLVIASVARVDGKWNVCLGAVAPIPWVSAAANEILGNKDITEELAIKAGDAAAQGAKPMSENGYKVQLVKVAVKRALLAAAGMEVPA